MKVGFIGLGVMGNHMAANIQKKGYKLTVFDVNKVVLEEFKSRGAETAQSPAEVARNSEVIFTSLPNSDIVKNVIQGEGGVLEGAAQGSIIVDLSSITPKAIQDVYKEALKKQVEVLDAPVSGGSAGALAGTLTIMVGGKKEALDKVRPLLECVGKTIHHVGDVGAGDTLKLVNNLLLRINMAATAEALVLGAKAGLDPEVMFDVISQSSGNSYALKAKYPNFIAKGNFDPGFAIDLQYKDLELAISTAKSLEMPLLLGNVTQQLYEVARSEGLGKKDISSVINLYEKWADQEVRKEEK